MSSPRAPRESARGASLVEVLVTLLILAFGLLGVAGLQAKVGKAQIESYQRSQALLLLEAMAERLSANLPQAASYVTAAPIGTGDSEPTDCTTSSTPSGPSRDLCEWSNALKGAAENNGSAVGAMIGARACITQVAAPNPALGACTPGEYQVSVAWQGLTATKAPALACAANLYGDESYRRVIAVNVSAPTTSCYVP